VCHVTVFHAIRANFQSASLGVVTIDLLEITLVLVTSFLIKVGLCVKNYNYIVHIITITLYIITITLYIILFIIYLKCL